MVTNMANPTSKCACGTNHDMLRVAIDAYQFIRAAGPGKPLCPVSVAEVIEGLMHINTMALMGGTVDKLRSDGAPEAVVFEAAAEFNKGFLEIAERQSIMALFGAPVLRKRIHDLVCEEVQDPSTRAMALEGPDKETLDAYGITSNLVASVPVNSTDEAVLSAIAALFDVNNNGSKH